MPTDKHGMKIVTVLSRYKKFFKSLGTAVALIFRASPLYFCLNCLFSICLGFLPILPLLVWRNLINELATYLSGTGDGALLSTIVFSAAMYCLILVVQESSRVISQLVSLKYGDEIDYFIEHLLIDATVSADLAFFDSSELRNRLNVVSNNSNYVLCRIPMVLCDLIQALVWVIASIVIIKEVSLWVLLVLLLLTIPQTLANKKNQKRNYEFQKKTAGQERKLGYYQSLYQGKSLFETRLYDLKNYFHDLYKNEWSDLRSKKLNHSLKGMAIGTIGYIATFVSSIFTYAVVITKYFAGRIAIGDLIYYVSLMSQFCSRTNDVFDCLNEISDLSEHFDDIYDFLHRKPLIQQGGSRQPSSNPQIEFRNVSFRYPNTELDVLKNCSFVIHPGEIVGLVGVNGAGKSTIVKLLCRFYDPSEGQILLDGIDAREYDLTLLRKLFCALFQDYAKYSLTLRENVAISDIDRVQQDNDIIEACEKSHLNDLVHEWENSIDEQLTRNFNPDGKELSGGQWQRVSLARAFFGKGSIVLLDEPSATLDPFVEHEIFEQFTRISCGKSAMLISHRLSSVTMSDTIMVLDSGHIIERGTHSELLNQNGMYAQLFNLQAQRYDETL